MKRSLLELGIELQRPNQPGEHRAACPWCAKGPRDDALAVLVEPDGGATWFCHRCEAKGATGKESVANHSAFAGAGKPSCRHENPGRHEVLSDWGSTLWEACHPIEAGTIAATYLEGRGCILPPEDGHLRWHPALCDLVSKFTGPALVGLVTDPETGTAINLHRTWLAPDGSGKAPIDKPRRLLKGHPSRGVIRLWPDDEATMGLVLAEGIETALVGAKAGLVPVWSTISAGNLARFPVLAGIVGLTILVDHDRPNPKTGKRAGIEAARELVERYTAAGFDPKRDLRIFLPPTEGQDAADLEVPA